jgi:hypothetical protein
MHRFSKFKEAISVPRGKKRENKSQIFSITGIPYSSTMPFYVQRKYECACDGDCPVCSEARISRSGSADTRKNIRNKKSNSMQGEIFGQPPQPRAAPRSRVHICDKKIINAARTQAIKIMDYAIKRFDDFIRILKSVIGTGGDKSRLSKYRAACALLSNFNLDPYLTSDQDYYSIAGSIRNNMGRIQSVLNKLRPSTDSNILETQDGDIVCVEINDPRADKYGAFVVNKQLPVYVCPSWVVDYDTDMQAAVLIHEIAHVTGMSDVQYTRLKKKRSPPSPGCGTYTRFTIKPAKAKDNPDSYAYFAVDFMVRPK